jgi:hypothetical protein
LNIFADAMRTIILRSFPATPLKTLGLYRMPKVSLRREKEEWRKGILEQRELYDSLSPLLP